jgi:dTDP-4-amino-4,6-dideoxygalactose transaminase
MAAHRQPPYLGSRSLRVPLPVTEWLTERTLILPLYHQLEAHEQAIVIDALLSPVAVVPSG